MKIKRIWGNEMTAMQNNLAYPADIVATPEKAISDYFISRKIDSELVKKLPDWDVAGDFPVINLLAAKRDLVEAKQTFSSEKAVYDAKTKDIDEKWERLQVKEKELQDTLKKNDQVKKNNLKERKKSEKQIAEEEAEKQRIQLEINDLEKQLQNYQAAEAKLSEKVSELKIYEDFLQKVVDAYPEFSCIDDVLNRYETLIETREEMRELQMKSVNQVENVRKEVEKITKECMLEMHQLNQNLYAFRMKKFFVQKELVHWAQAIEELRDMGREEYHEITQAIEGIWLLYLNVCSARKQDPQFGKSCLQEQLKYIIDNINLLSGVLDESRIYFKRSRIERKGRSLPSARELDKWSTDYEMFQSVRSNRVEGSKK